MAGKRLRRSVIGFNRRQVGELIASQEKRIARLEQEAGRLAERLRDKERELAELQRRQSPAAIAALGRRLEELHGQARRQATRIRMKALEDAIEVAARVSELARIGDRLAADDPGAADGAPADEGVYQGDVEVEVGPLRDFAQLAGFEDAAGGIDAASEITLKRFSAGRATVSMSLSEPVDLLRELEERAPFEFRVGRRTNGRLVLDVHAGER